MKRMIIQHQDIEGMSRIGFLNKQGNPESRSEFELYVNTDDGGNIPHMHVHIKDEHDACIRYDCAEYFNHGKNNNKVSSEVAKMIDTLLRRRSDEDDMTYWQIAIMSWNINNSSRKLSKNMEQPDYTQLNK